MISGKKVFCAPVSICKVGHYSLYFKAKKRLNNSIYTKHFTWYLAQNEHGTALATVGDQLIAINMGSMLIMPEYQTRTNFTECMGDLSGCYHEEPYQTWAGQNIIEHELGTF